MPNRRKHVNKKKKKKTKSNSLSLTKAIDSECKDITTCVSEEIIQKPCPPLTKLNKPGTSDYDNGGVKRIFSPFAKFNNTTGQKSKLDKMAYDSAYRSNGLSNKEKCYLLTSCQTRNSRYLTIKSLAAAAVKENKVFTIRGNCNAVRKALLERGWVERIPPNRMNLSKVRNRPYRSKTDMHNELETLLLSNFVEKCIPNFIWYAKDDCDIYNAIDMTKDNNTIVNKLKLDALWTTKQGLASSMRDNYWYYIEDVAEVNGPRTYSSYDSGEMEDFIKDYKITACTSLLKWILSMVANERPIFAKTGNISLNVIVFALNRCKEYLFRKQNKDIDKTPNMVSTSQWNTFLKKYYRIISKDDVFQVDKENKLPLYLVFAKFLLKEIHRYRPQLSCEGCHNIWIIKPAHCSRGRGIRMASKLVVINDLLNKANFKYVVQKYIEEPLLIHETKFDIRQYYLVTSTYPLVIWMYTNCYLKFSSQNYSLKNFHESIHLTNNAVQRKYTNGKNRHPELPQNNMWDLDTYKQYLNRIGKEKVWDNIIFPGMKKSIIGIMLTCQDSLTVSKNRYELYGCDFILDKEYKPWLIEINSNPDLAHTTQVTGKICPEVVSDIIKVVLDYAANSKASTGKFRCVYRQPLTMPRYGAAIDLSVRGCALPPDYFYRGKVKLEESYDDADIEKERDVKAILEKLKRMYDADNIMIQPEEDDSIHNYTYAKKIEKETCTHSTRSEMEMDVAAAFITKQLDKLLDRITSDHTLSSKTAAKHASLGSVSIQKVESIHCIRSVADIRTILRKSLPELTEAKKGTRSFVFSKLDDGPKGKGSYIYLDQIEGVWGKRSSICFDQIEEAMSNVGITKAKHESLDSMSSKNFVAAIPSIQSIADLSSLLKTFPKFTFSKLDDGPQGKASSIHIDPIERAFSSLKIKNGLVKSVGPDYIARASMVQAANKMISFLNLKEVEYSKDCIK